MAVGDAGTFCPIRPPGPADSILQVGDAAWAAVLDFPLLPSASMSADAAASLLEAFARFLVGGLSSLSPSVSVQLVVVQQPLRLATVAQRYEEAAGVLGAISAQASDLAWQWGDFLRRMQGGGLATRRGGVVLTAVRRPVGFLQRLRTREKADRLTGDEAATLLRSAVRQVMDAGKDAGFALSPLVGGDLAAFVSRWTRGEALPVREVANA